MNLEQLPEKYHCSNSRLTELGQGHYAKVYKLETGEGSFAVKTFSSTQEAVVEAKVLELWRNSGITTPQHFDIAYSITDDSVVNVMELIEAPQIADLPTEEIKRLLPQISINLAKIHQHDGKNWGTLDETLSGKFTSLNKAVGYFYQKSHQGLIEEDLLTDGLESKLNKALDVISSADPESVICHFDYFIHGLYLVDNEIMTTDPNAISLPAEFELANLIIHLSMDDRFDDQDIKSSFAAYLKHSDRNLDLNLVPAWFILFLAYKMQKWTKIGKEGGAKKAAKLLELGYEEVAEMINRYFV